MVLAHLRAPIPDQVREQWMPGRVTLVEVTDFDCPQCQRTDAILKRVLPRHQLRVIRLVAPMPAHENAWPAARAYLAAKRQSKGDEMADALFAAKSRSAKECRRIAADLGLDLDEFDRALSDPATGTELRATVEWAKNAGTGLPLIWIQDQFLQGVPTAEDLEAAIARAESSRG
jgi:predicted DsbA family dithiol-disulfide isomerase